MALYLNVKRVMKFPAVINSLPKPSTLWKRIKTKVSGVRVSPGGPASSPLGGQIDVTAITGVPVLKRNGHR